MSAHLPDLTHHFSKLMTAWGKLTHITDSFGQADKQTGITHQLINALAVSAKDFENPNGETRAQVKELVDAYYAAMARLVNKDVNDLKRDHFKVALEAFASHRNNPHFNAIRGMLLYVDTLNIAEAGKPGWLRQFSLAKILFTIEFWSDETLSAPDQKSKLKMDIRAAFKVGFCDEAVKQRRDALLASGFRTAQEGICNTLYTLFLPGSAAVITAERKPYELEIAKEALKEAEEALNINNMNEDEIRSAKDRLDKCKEEVKVKEGAVKFATTNMPYYIMAAEQDLGKKCHMTVGDYEEVAAEIIQAEREALEQAQQSSSLTETKSEEEAQFEEIARGIAQRTQKGGAEIRKQAEKMTAERHPQESRDKVIVNSFSLPGDSDSDDEDDDSKENQAADQSRQLSRPEVKADISFKKEEEKATQSFNESSLRTIAPKLEAKPVLKISEDIDEAFFERDDSAQELLKVEINEEDMARAMSQNCWAPPPSVPASPKNTHKEQMATYVSEIAKKIAAKEFLVAASLLEASKSAFGSLDSKNKTHYGRILDDLLEQLKKEIAHQKIDPVMKAIDSGDIENTERLINEAMKFLRPKPILRDLIVQLSKEIFNRQIQQITKAINASDIQGARLHVIDGMALLSRIGLPVITRSYVEELMRFFLDDEAVSELIEQSIEKARNSEHVADAKIFLQQALKLSKSTVFLEIKYAKQLADALKELDDIITQRIWDKIKFASESDTVQDESGHIKAAFELLTHIENADLKRHYKESLDAASVETDSKVAAQIERKILEERDSISIEAAIELRDDAIALCDFIQNPETKENCENSIGQNVSKELDRKIAEKIDADMARALDAADKAQDGMDCDKAREHMRRACEVLINIKDGKCKDHYAGALSNLAQEIDRIIYHKIDALVVAKGKSLDNIPKAVSLWSRIEKIEDKLSYQKKLLPILRSLPQPPIISTMAFYIRSIEVAISNKNFEEANFYLEPAMSWLLKADKNMVNRPMYQRFLMDYCQRAEISGKISDDTRMKAITLLIGPLQNVVGSKEFGKIPEDPFLILQKAEFFLEGIEKAEDKQSYQSTLNNLRAHLDKLAPQQSEKPKSVAASPFPLFRNSRSSQRGESSRASVNSNGSSSSSGSSSSNGSSSSSGSSSLFGSSRRESEKSSRGQGSDKGTPSFIRNLLEK